MSIPTVDQMRQLMDKTENLRCISCLGPAGHGKSTLIDLLVCQAEAGITSAAAAGDPHFTDTRAHQQEQGFTQSTGVPLHLQHDEEDGKGAVAHLINLLAPAGADFSSEVTVPLLVKS